MTDHDRGAYTPQTDEPLAFDARRPSERRPIPMTLIGSAVVLVALVAGVALVYRGGVRGAGDAPRPVGSPVMSVKTAPAPVPVEVQNTTSTSDLYAESKPATTATPPVVVAPVATNTVSASAPTQTVVAATPVEPPPTFAAAPEAPAARPKPKRSTLAMIAPPAPKPIVVKPAATHTTARTPAAGLDAGEVAAAGATTVSRTTTRTTSKSSSAPIKLAQASTTVATKTHATAISAEDDGEAATPPVKPVAAKVASPGTASIPAGGGASVVQIGAFSSSELSDKGYADVSAVMAGRMGGKSKHVLALDHEGKTLYRTWLSGFASRADAISFCEALRAGGKACFVKS